MTIYVTGDTHGASQIGSAPSYDIQDGVLNPCDYKTKEAYKADYRRMRKTGASFRVKGVSWWSQEQLDACSEAAAVQALEDAGWRGDFIFTHDCAISDRCVLGYPGGTTRINHFLEEIKAKIDYRHWFFGHLHGNEDLPGHKEHLIYEQIIQID